MYDEAIKFFFFSEITNPPRPVNVSVNGVANFSCTAVAQAFRWEANGVQIDNTEEISINTVKEDGELRRSILSIKISSTDNATNITCTAISFESTVTCTNVSASALLLVQGMRR